MTRSVSAHLQTRAGMKVSVLEKHVFEYCVHLDHHGYVPERPPNN
jgi:hypothetical protein